MICKRVSTSKNQSYSEKKRGRPNRSVTAPSATGIDPTLPPLNKSVRRLLALSRIFLLDFFLSVLIDWHLHSTQTWLIHRLTHDMLLPSSDHKTNTNKKIKQIKTLELYLVAETV